MTTEPTEREQLAREVFIADNSGQTREASLADWETFGPIDKAYAHTIADGLQAAGYSRPRTVTEYGIVFNNHAHGLIPPALSLAEFKERYPNESYGSITDRAVYITRTIQVVDPSPTAWEVLHDGGAS